MQKSQEYILQGYDWVVDIDLEKFFDRVNHDMLTLAPAASAGVARVARVVKDKRVLKLIRAYLESGVMLNGVVMETEEGTPQGGPKHASNDVAKSLLLDLKPPDQAIF